MTLARKEIAAMDCRGEGRVSQQGMHTRHVRQWNELQITKELQRRTS